MLDKAIFADRRAQTERPDGFAGWSDAGHRTAMRMDPTGRTAGPMPFTAHLDLETILGAQEAPASSAPLAAAAAPAPAGGDDAYSFADVIDIINPLQHLPVVGTLYRQLTGDTIKGMSAILGGALFGGPIGAVVSTADVIVRDRTGMDATQNLMALAGLPTGGRAVVTPEITYASAMRPLGNNPDALRSYGATTTGGRNFAAGAVVGGMRLNA